MLEKSLVEFSDVLSTKEPVPGGGGASAYVASLGIALGQMVGSLTVGKKKYADVEPEIIELNKKAEALRKRFQELVEEDAKVFYPLSKAYSLPKETEEEKAYKDKILQEALVDATMVPLNIVRLSVEALDLVADYADKGSTIAISDAGCAASFLKAAIEGGKLNVLINTKLMKNAELKAQVEAELAELCTNGIAKANAIYQSVENKLH